MQTPLWDVVNSNSVRTAIYCAYMTWPWWSNQKNFSHNSPQLHLMCSSARLTKTLVCPSHYCQDCPLTVTVTMSQVSQSTESLLPEQDQTLILEEAQESLPSCTAGTWKEKRLREIVSLCRAGLRHKDHSKTLALLQGRSPMSPTSLAASRTLGICKNSLLMLTRGRDMLIGRCWQN